VFAVVTRCAFSHNRALEPKNNLQTAPHKRSDSCSAIPGLHDNLACDFSALKLDHRRAEHPGSISTALREGETLAHGDAVFDLVSHIAPVDVIKIGRDRTLAFQVAWFARRIVTINYLNNGIFTIQVGKRAGVAAFDRALEPSDGDGLGLGL
jgi:hypothetical protein